MAEPPTLHDYVDADHAPRTVDPGCDACGTCIGHDGCADSQHPLQPGDCEDCGACAGCITDCEVSRTAEVRVGSVWHRRKDGVRYEVAMSGRFWVRLENLEPGRNRRAHRIRVESFRELYEPAPGR